MTYAKRKGSDTWHFMETCRNYPLLDPIIRHNKPTSGEYCNQCVAKAKAAKLNALIKRVAAIR